jgi:endonuclease/exonuclease/phosphatase family metal-dependent hydrolase
VLVSVYRLGTFNALFGGHGDFGIGAPDRWEGQVRLLQEMDLDVLAVQEASFFDLFGRRRLHRMVNDLGMAQGMLAEANETTTGHRFHTAILISDRVRVVAHGADRSRYHHVLGWATLDLPGLPGPLEIRNLHLDPFDPRNRAREVAPLGVLAQPGRLAAVLGDGNGVGSRSAEPDWAQLPAHLLNGHLGLPGRRGQDVEDRSALNLLERAGFHDAAVLAGRQGEPTAGFEPGDVPRRQDVILASSDLAPMVRGMRVHREFVQEHLSDHAAVSVEIHTGRCAP